MLYTCSECKKGNHGKCAGSQNIKPGHFGGSMCQCKCGGNPLYVPFSRTCQHGIDEGEYCSQCHAKLQIKCGKTYEI